MIFIFLWLKRVQILGLTDSFSPSRSSLAVFGFCQSRICQISRHRQSIRLSVCLSVSQSFSHPVSEVSWLLRQEVSQLAHQFVNSSVCKSGNSFVGQFDSKELCELGSLGPKVNSKCIDVKRLLMCSHIFYSAINWINAAPIFISDSYDITDISGANAQDKTLDEISQENNVIVLTAQILVDALKSKRVRITDFSLLIFDECHHTGKGHPYNEIMLAYLGIKFSSQGKQTNSLPQVIGLTASLGVGKARNKNDAQDHILQLCANLDCSMIATVEEHIKDLEGKLILNNNAVYGLPFQVCKIDNLLLFMSIGRKIENESPAQTERISRLRDYYFPNLWHS